MAEWGRAMFVTPGIVVDGKLITTDLVEINLGLRILLGSSFYDDWQDGETFVKADPLGNPVDQRHPWNQTTTAAGRRSATSTGKYTWVMSPRWYDKRTGEHLALDTGGGPLARLWVTALAGLVDIGYVKATGQSVKIYLPKTATLPEVEFEWKIPRWSNTLERDRARTYFQAYAAAAALYFVEQALEEVHAGRTRTWTEFTRARRGDRLRLPRGGARRAVASRGDPRRQDRQLSSLSADLLERQPARLATARPGPTKTRCRTRRSSRRTARTTSRASTSCAPCAASIPACRAASTCISGDGRADFSRTFTLFRGANSGREVKMSMGEIRSK